MVCDFINSAGHQHFHFLLHTWWIFHTYTFSLARTIMRADARTELHTELKMYQDNNTLRDIQGLLGCNNFSQETLTNEFLDYRTSLQNYEKQSFLVETLLNDHDIETFKQDQNGQLSSLSSWTKSERPRVRVIYGQNNESRNYALQCWASLVAVDRIDRLTRNGNDNPYAYFIFRDQGILYHQVIPRVLFQLLHTQSAREALRNTHEDAEIFALLHDLKAAAEADERLPTSPPSGPIKSRRVTRPDSRMQALQKLAIRVVRLFKGSETVEIIIDRLDLCRVRQENVEVDHRRRVLDTLVRMAQEAEARVQVMVVVNGHGWPELREVWDEEPDMQESIILDVRKQRTSN